MSPPGIPRLAAGLSLLPWLQWYSLPFTEVFCLPCTLYNSYHHAIGNNLNLAVLVAFRGFNVKSAYIVPQQPEQCSEAQVREDQLVIFSPGWFRLPASCLATPAFLVIAGGSEKTSVYSIQVCVYSEGKINQSEHCCLPCNFSWRQLRDQIVDFFKQSLEKTWKHHTGWWWPRRWWTREVFYKQDHTQRWEKSNNVLQPSCSNNHCKYLTLNEEKSRVRCLEFWRRDHEKMWSLFLMRRKSHWGWSTQRLEGRQHHQRILIQTLLIGDTILFTPACKILDNAMADQKSDNLTSLGPCFTRYCQISPTATSWFLVGLSKVIKAIFKFPGKLDSCVSTTSDDPDDEDWAVTVSHR